MFSFGCPSCQKKLQLQEEHAGKRIKCPGCGQVSVAPIATLEATPPPSIPTAPTPPADHTDEDPNPPMETRHVAKPGRTESILTDFLAPPQEPDELGRLGKYRILSIIGRGGMGIVYQAEDSVLGRKVALKAILPSLGASVNVRKRFMREARAMAAVESDHIVRLYDVNEDRGVPFIAMEFLTGVPLDKRLDHGSTVPLDETLRIGREIAEGLAAAHARGLIHRDIKPANIWLERAQGRTGLGFPRVKILDFGLARAAEEDARLTHSGAVLGTPAYMAPEQGRGEKVDFRCDLFSLGVVLYRLCTGLEPFTAKDAVSTMMAIAKETPAPPQIQNLDVPTELSDLIMKLLEKDPAQRGGSAQEVAETLLHIERQLRGEVSEAPRSSIRIASVAPSVALTPLQSKQPFPWIIIAIADVAAFGCLSVTLAVIGLALVL